MIALVEGAARQKTPNEIALHILLVGLTLVFLFACVTLVPLALYSSASGSPRPRSSRCSCASSRPPSAACSPPSASPGMDRLLRKNVLAMSGRAVEAAGDVDTLLLDKTGTITLGNRMATELLPAPGVTVEDLADAAQLASLADETPEGRSIVVLAKERYGLRGREVRERGAPLHPLHRADAHERLRPRRARQIRKGAVDAIATHVAGARRRPCRPSSSEAAARHRRHRRHAARGLRRRARARHHPPQGRGEGRHQGALRPLPRHGHPHRDDHRRQPAHRRGHRRARPASTTSSPRRRPRRRCASSRRSRRRASSWR